MTQFIRGIHHIAIIVSDIERSKDFYIDVLGGRIIAENYRSDRQSWKIDIALASVQLELFTFPDALSRPSHPEAQGLRHLAFAVSNVEDVRRTLEAHNIPTEETRIDPYTNQRFFFTADPDSLPIEFYEDPKIQQH